MSTFVVEAIFHWAAVGLYAAAIAVFAHAVLFEHVDRVRWGLWVLFSALVPHSLALGLRWVTVGHGPYMLKYEVLSSNAWIAAVMLLLFVWRQRRWAPMTLVALPVLVLMMGLALFSNPEARELPPTLRSVWLTFHVLFNKLAVGAFLLSAASAFMLLRKLRGATGRFFDKLPLRWSGEDHGIAEVGARVVPPATVRRGAFVGRDAVLMPSYVNIGAWVGAGTMVDTWATVGSCAQIGANVHLSGGVGIGGVLEPLQANPTIIEDDCFIGARSEVVEGVIIERGCVLSMGVFIGQSTKIYHRASGEILRGRVPAGSVVVPGSLPAADGSHALYCAVIVKEVDEQTRSRTSVNEILRHAE